ncbi:MAG TPA: RIP metalloprotease RseP [Gemmatimonadales bacterium]|nr:RIP metalloprotease RseP [Gemmatimonadales bacterium]
MTSFIIGLLSLIVVLGVLVFVHEAGHFIAAKWAGIYVHRFSLGLGAPIPWLTRRRGETEYSISWLPLGGYVKMASREEDAAAAMLEGGEATAGVPPDRVFEAKPVWKRMVVILAGVAMNAVLAWVVYVGLAYKNGRQVNLVTTVGGVDTTGLPAGAAALRSLPTGVRIAAIDGKPVTTWNEIEAGILNAPDDRITLRLADGSEVKLDIHPDALTERAQVIQALRPLIPAVVDSAMAGGPAARAGFRSRDSIVSVAGVPIRQWRELQQVVDARPGQRVAVTLIREGRALDFELTLDSAKVRGSNGVRTVGRIGVYVDIPVRQEPLSFREAVAAGTESTGIAATQIVRTVRGLFSGRVSTREVGGPILIGQMAGQQAQLGFDEFLSFMAFISINLAVLNLLPIPVLDGGQFLLLLAEGVLRRPLPLKLRERLTALGLVFVVLLMVLAFSNDIRRLLGG